MSVEGKGAGERLFEAFVDPADMVGVFGADTPLREIQSVVAGEGLRFPLVCDEEASLSAHLEAMEYASGSARFGPFCDNILGMNWRLPDGRLVRVGEQVVKSTTGYDLQRFLLHMGRESGRAEQMVVRLRPKGAATVEGVYAGEGADLERLGMRLRGSVWSHWLDEVDLCLENGLWRLEISANCLSGEETLYLRYLEEAGDELACRFQRRSLKKSMALPGYCVKSLPGEARSLAIEQAGLHGGPVRIHFFNGYLLFWPEEDLEPGDWARLQAGMASSGGHVFGRKRAIPRAEREAEWMEHILSNWRPM